MKNVVAVLLMLTGVSLLSACGGPESPDAVNPSKSSAPADAHLSQREEALTLGSQTVDLQWRGATWGTQESTLQCPAGYVAVAIHGFDVWDGTVNGRVIESIGLKCRYLNSNLSLGGEVSIAPVGGAGRGSPYHHACPTEQAIVGLRGRSGDVIDALGSTCASPTRWMTGSGASYSSPMAGGAGGTSFADLCASPSLVSAIKLRTNWYITQQQATCVSVVHDGTQQASPMAQFSGTVGSSYEAHHGPITVEPGTTLTVAMTGTGEPDLYLRFSTQPDYWSYDCAPFMDGPNEGCSLVAPPSVISAYLMVSGYTTDTYSVVVTAR